VTAGVIIIPAVIAPVFCINAFLLMFFICIGCSIRYKLTIPLQKNTFTSGFQPEVKKQANISEDF
jgi:hypothetical protein